MYGHADLNGCQPVLHCLQRIYHYLGQRRRVGQRVFCLYDTVNLLDLCLQVFCGLCQFCPVITL